MFGLSVALSMDDHFCLTSACFFFCSSSRLSLYVSLGELVLAVSDSSAFARFSRAFRLSSRRAS